MAETLALPTSPDVERLVLGSVLLDDSILHEVRPVLSTDDFSLENHRRIWNAACALFDAGRHVDYVTVLEEMRRVGDLDPDGISYITSLNDGLPQFPNLSSYSRILQEQTTRRRLIAMAHSLMNRAAGGEPVQQILDSLGKAALTMPTPAGVRGLVSAKGLVDSVGISQLLSPRRERGLMSPWRWWNDATCGMLPGELWILAGHTSTGKTSAALQFGVQAARKGTGVAVFSLEMGTQSLFQRAVYQISRVDSERAKRGALIASERRAQTEAANELYGLPLYFDDSTASTVMAIHAAVRRQKLESAVGLVIVDYLQLLGPGGRHSTRAEEVGANARALKLMANDFACPLLVLSQFSRESAKAKGNDAPRRPELYDLKESGDIENHANGVWFIHRPNPQDAEQVPVEFILPKQRDGRRNIMQEFWFFPKYQRFDGKENE